MYVCYLSGGAFRQGISQDVETGCPKERNTPIRVYCKGNKNRIIKMRISCYFVAKRPKRYAWMFLILLIQSWSIEIYFKSKRFSRSNCKAEVA